MIRIAIILMTFVLIFSACTNVDNESDKSDTNNNEVAEKSDENVTANDEVNIENETSDEELSYELAAQKMTDYVINLTSDMELLQEERNYSYDYREFVVYDKDNETLKVDIKWVTNSDEYTDASVKMTINNKSEVEEFEYSGDISPYITSVENYKIHAHQNFKQNFYFAIRGALYGEEGYYVEEDGEYIVTEMGDNNNKYVLDKKCKYAKRELVKELDGYYSNSELKILD